MTTEYEAALCEFLAQKENLPIALEISEHIAKVTQRVGNRFWEGVNIGIKRKLGESGADARWRLDLMNRGDDVVGFYLVPRDAREPGDALRYQFMEEDGTANRTHLSQGLLLPSRVAITTETGIDSLRDSLLAEGYRRTKRWVAWKYVRDFASLNEFIITAADRGDEFALAVAETFWDFFDATHSEVERVNSLLLAPSKPEDKPK